MVQVSPPHILLLEARFYEDLADELAGGAIAAFEAAGATYERVGVPGALELPLALGQASMSGLIPADDEGGIYHGAIALGVVIRGDTYHFELVANETGRGLTQLAMLEAIPFGNGVLTVENADQAWARAKGGLESKGADAARACLRLIEIGAQFEAQYKASVQA